MWTLWVPCNVSCVESRPRSSSPSNVDTVGTLYSVLCREPSSFQGATLTSIFEI